MKPAKIVLTLIFGCFFYFAIYPFLIGGSKMEEFCNSVVPGDQISNVIARAEVKGFWVPEKTDDVILIAQPRTMGRFLCAVSIEGSNVVEKNFIVND